MADTRINGYEYNWSSVEYAIDNVRYTGSFTKIDYERKRSRGMTRGKGPKRRGTTRGKEDCTASFSMFKADFEALKAQLLVSTLRQFNDSFQDVPFNLPVSYEEGGIVITDTLVECRIDSVKNSHSADSDDALMVDVELNLADIVYNGELFMSKAGKSGANVGDFVFFKPLRFNNGAEREMVPALVVEKHEKDNGAVVLFIFDQKNPSYTLVNPSDEPKDGCFCSSFKALSDEEKAPDALKIAGGETFGTPLDELAKKAELGKATTEDLPKGLSKEQERDVKKALSDAGLDPNAASKKLSSFPRRARTAHLAACRARWARASYVCYLMRNWPNSRPNTANSLSSSATTSPLFFAR